MSLITLNWERMVTVTVKMILAIVCSGILGVERGRKNRPAGFRTYMLVCIGATLVMMTNQFISGEYMLGDPSRMGAQVISGIGFLGAGTIITTGHNRVKGLTTAAGLWASACIGLAIGIGFFEGAIIGTVMIFVVMVSMQTLDNRIMASTRLIVLYIEIDKITAMKNLTEFLKEKNIKLVDIQSEKTGGAGTSGGGAVVTLMVPSQKLLAMLTYMIGSVEGITYVEQL